MAKKRIAKRTLTKKKKPVKVKKKNTYTVKLTRSNADIIEDLRKKYKTYKNISKKLRISEKAFREIRFFYYRREGGKKPGDIFNRKLYALAEKAKVETVKKIKVFRGELIGENLITDKFKIDKKANYIHAIFTVKVTKGNYHTFTDIYSQVYYPPITK